ncbi:MAG: hypothetical protein PUP93_25825 [Rhizonema sp. NSF051]|nr:hypothetical protein [Rhizonema sp. NSF051]
MSYCPNPDCEDRENLHTSEVCRTCKTPLLIHDRYRIIYPLRERETNPTEIFFIRCLNTELPFVLKTLISKDDKTQKLFQREQRLLKKFTDGNKQDNLWNSFGNKLKTQKR